MKPRMPLPTSTGFAGAGLPCSELSWQLRAPRRLTPMPCRRYPAPHQYCCGSGFSAPDTGADVRGWDQHLQQLGRRVRRRISHQRQQGPSATTAPNSRGVSAALRICITRGRWPPTPPSTVDGHSIFDNHDYSLSLGLVRDKLGSCDFRRANFGTWYNGDGGFYPPSGAYFPLSDSALTLDRSEISFEGGLRMEKIPQITFRYSHRPRRRKGLNQLGADSSCIRCDSRA